jgi:hypothetical protein
MKLKLLLVVVAVVSSLVVLVHAQEQQTSSSSAGLSQTSGIDSQGSRITCWVQVMCWRFVCWTAGLVFDGRN